MEDMEWLFIGLVCGVFSVCGAVFVLKRIAMNAEGSNTLIFVSRMSIV